MFDPNNFTLSSVFSFQTAWLIKGKAVYLKVFFHIIYLFISLIGWDHNLCIFSNYVIFNFSEPSSAGYRR